MHYSSDLLTNQYTPFSTRTLGLQTLLLSFLGVWIIAVLIPFTNAFSTSHNYYRSLDIDTVLSILIYTLLDRDSKLTDNRKYYNTIKKKGTMLGGCPLSLHSIPALRHRSHGNRSWTLDLSEVCIWQATGIYYNINLHCTSVIPLGNWDLRSNLPTSQLFTIFGYLCKNKCWWQLDVTKQTKSLLQFSALHIWTTTC